MVITKFTFRYEKEKRITFTSNFLFYRVLTVTFKDTNAKIYQKIYQEIVIFYSWLTVILHYSFLTTWWGSFSLFKVWMN